MSFLTYHRTLSIKILAIALLFSNVSTLVVATALPMNLWSTFRTTVVSDTISFDTFYPKSNFTTYGPEGFPLGPNLSFSSIGLENASRNFLRFSGMNDKQLANLIFESGFTNGEFGYAYFFQSFQGIRLIGGERPRFVNTRINVAFKGDKVTAYGTSKVNAVSKMQTGYLTDDEATERLQSSALETKLNAKLSPVPAIFRCLHISFDPLQPGLVGRTAFSAFPFENVETGAQYEAYIDGETGDFLGAVDFVSHLPFTVVPATKEGLNEGLTTFPKSWQLHDPLSSPIGWTAYDVFHNTSATVGNNVAVTVDGSPAQVDSTLQFDRVYDQAKPLDDPDNKAAAGANAFYVMNIMHDMTYRYGFTEDAFNFQSHSPRAKQAHTNQDPDDLLVFMHDARGHVDGPRFMTPPDGQQPHCYLPAGGPGAVYAPGARDAAMDNTVLIHEYAHGVTNRLVGGGTSKCLQTFEASGLGEGFADAMANWMAQDAALTKDFVIGAYFSNSASGMRRYPYSTNFTINPLKYSDIGDSSMTTSENHIGEVWATILHNVYAALVEEFHFTPNKLRAPDSEQGNAVFMRIFMDTLSLLPCNPTVLQARDAWIQADMARYGDMHVCTMYKAFASRGLGVGAGEASYTGDDKVPNECSA